MARQALSVLCRRLAFCVPAALLLAAPVAAQEAVRDSPAHIALVEGAAVLERDGQTDRAPSSMPLLAGDRVRTETGRVEILFADGSTLHLDHNTVVDFQSDEVIRLLDGRVRLTIVGPARTIAYRVDAPAAWVDIRQPGEYRVSIVSGARGREVELAVLRGSAELVNENGATDLRAGERAYAVPEAAPSEPYIYNSAAWDAFDRWSEDRRDTRLGLSTQYLPNEVRHYSSTFDRYGDWRYEAQYGYVWYPRATVVGWRPYYHGRWAHLRPYGWTWIGADPWAWPTHHYGRWGFSAGVWFWIPGRVWGPSWVSWAYAPGYVSWCPLGWNDRPVFGFSARYVGGRRYDPWHAWTVVPHRRFGTGFVNINVVNITRIDVRTRSAFVQRREPPTYTGYAVPRAQTPIRMAGARGESAIPRSSVSGDRPPTSGREASEAFRRRGAPGDGLSGPGFPAAARVPRERAAPRPGDVPAARSGERTPAYAPREREGGSLPRATPREGREASPAAPAGRTPPRRAEPRGDGAATAPGRPGESSPSRDSGTAPPSRGSSGSSAAPATRPGSGRSRAVPRGGGGGTTSSPARPSRAPRTESAPDRPVEVFRGRPPADAGRAPARPDRSGGDRAIPRAPEGAPPPTFSRPEGNRSARPSGPPAGRARAPESRPSPPPSAGPPARSAPPRAASPSRGGSSQPQARPRGGGSSGGGQGSSRRAGPRGGN